MMYLDSTYWRRLHQALKRLFFFLEPQLIRGQNSFHLIEPRLLSKHHPSRRITLRLTTTASTSPTTSTCSSPPRYPVSVYRISIQNPLPHQIHEYQLIPLDIASPSSLHCSLPRPKKSPFCHASATPIDLHAAPAPRSCCAPRCSPLLVSSSSSFPPAAHLLDVI